MTTPADEPTDTTPLLAEEKENKGFLQKGAGAVTGAVGSVAGVFGGAVRSAASLAQGAGVNLESKLGEGYNKGTGAYDKLFLKHKNKAFGDHLEMASRGACFVVLLALPFVLPEEVCPLCQKVVRLEIYTAASITYFIYTLYVTTGDILHFAQGGITGTLFAVVSIWLMQGFMPGGYTDEEPHRWPIGSVWGITFVFLILWLNFDGNTRIFALSTYVWYWMAFLMPNYQAGFAQNFQIKLDGKAIKELLVATAGCSMAVFAGYFPYPIYAQAKALDVSRSMMDQIFMAKQDFLTYYCTSENSDRLKVKILQKEIGQLASEASSVGDLLDSAWYECLGMGAAQRQRVMMAKFQHYISTSIDILQNAFGVGTEETFDKAHQELMAAVTKDLQAVLDANGQILQTCIAFLNLATADPELQEYGKKHVEVSKAAVKDLSEHFKAKREELKMNRVSDDTAGENVVCLTFCKFQEETEALFNELTGEQKENNDWRHGGGIMGIVAPDVLMDKDHIMWTIRNGLSIIIAFYAGWHGYNKYISMYNASLAGTVSVLLSNFAGSAMTKNLSRLQGVVIGIVLGNLLYAFLGWCTWWGHLLVAIAIYCWTLLGLFMYFHSEQYSTVGLLLVVFGAQALMRPCSNDDTDPSGHGLIVNVTVAICIMTIVDLFLSQVRASDLAIQGLEETVKQQVQNMEKLFDDKEAKVEKRKGGVGAKIASTQSMGNEAYQEARYWRTDWPLSRFNQGITCLKAVRFNMMAIEGAVLEKPTEETPDEQMKKELFQKVIALKSFSGEGGLKDTLLTHYKTIMKALVDSLGDASMWEKGTAGGDVFIKRFEALKDLETGIRSTEDEGGAKIGTEDWNAEGGKFDVFVKELNNLYKKPDAPWQQTDTLHDDALAEMSVFVQCLQSMFTELDSVLDLVVV
jgi:hypothetical protein